jgi:hypothetical protein
VLHQLRRLNERSASLLLLLLLSTDFVFIVLHSVLHIIIAAFAPDASLCNTSGICSYMDIYHLMMLFWVIILFAYVLRSTRFAGYISWILVFTFFLFDDALLLHQKIGDHVAGIYDARPLYNLSLPPRYFELTTLAIMGFILLAIVAWAYLHSPLVFRKVSIDMLLFIAALVFFGLIVDLAEAARLGPGVILTLQIIEDGGEIVVDSLILWYVFLLALRNGKPDMFLHDLIRQP